ncbi:MAG: FtsH protease activity modulator HflK [Burkholderiaceae bacterium]
MSLNDPQWGRGSGSNDGRDGQQEEPQRQQPQRPPRGNDGPPDLDELWRDFNRRLNGLFGKKPNGSGNGGNRGGMPGGFKPDARGAGIGAAAILAVLALVWGGSGFYIVPEGQVGVVTTFGKYSESAGPGFRWHLPWPIESVDLVDVSSVRKAEVGTRGRSDRLKEALMLSDDENIVDMQFEVQYRIKDGVGAKDFLFSTRNPQASVTQAAESAMREVVGRRTMDSVLFESKQEIADQVKERMQEMLDRYGTGIQVMSIAIQNAQPPEQVQAAFSDAVKAGQDRERQINEGQAYANDVIPKARGTAERLKSEAEGYKSRIVETAEGDASRFKQVLTEYQKAPAVTRDRMYVDAMQQVFSNSTKVLVDSKAGNNLLYLPFDKLLQQGASPEAAAAARAAPPAAVAPVENAPAGDNTRGRDALRNRDSR